MRQLVDSIRSVVDSPCAPEITFAPRSLVREANCSYHASLSRIAILLTGFKLVFAFASPPLLTAIPT